MNPSRLSFGSFLPWLLVVCLASLAIVLTGMVISLRSSNLALATERDLATTAHRLSEVQLDERTLLAERMITDLGGQLRHRESLTRLKIATLSPLPRNIPDAQAIAVWDPETQNGLLAVEGLPAIADGQDYQIWIVDAEQATPLAGTVFKPDVTGKAKFVFTGNSPAPSVTGFVISLEKAHGSTEPEGPLVLRGSLR